MLLLPTGKSIYESDDIIQYLFSEYGDGNVPLALRLGFATTLTCGLALAPRLVGGGGVLRTLREEEIKASGLERGIQVAKIVKSIGDVTLKEHR
jgi:hypothetical protein